MTGFRNPFWPKWPWPLWPHSNFLNGLWILGSLYSNNLCRRHIVRSQFLQTKILLHTNPAKTLFQPSRWVLDCYLVCITHTKSLYFTAKIWTFYKLPRKSLRFYLFFSKSAPFSSLLRRKTGKTTHYRNFCNLQCQFAITQWFWLFNCVPSNVIIPLEL